MPTPTTAQDATEAKLKAKGFRFGDWMKESDQYEDAPEDQPRAFTMIRKPTRWSTQIAEVDPDGTVNGQTVTQYMKEI